MSVATITPTSSYRHRTQAYRLHPFQYEVNESASNSTVSDSSQGVDNLVVGGQRRVRAKAYEFPPQQERRSRAKGAMTSRYTRRSYSDPKTNAKETYVKDPTVVVQEVRRKSDSEHRHHRHRSEKEDGKEGERVRVYKSHRKSEGETARSRSGTIRRSTTITGDASRPKYEPQRTEYREPRRRHSERRPSHHEDKVQTPLRHEKRSIADHVPKSTRDRPPVTR